MDKMKFESADITSKNVEMIANLFPHVVTESVDKSGNIKRKVDYEKLKMILSGDLIEGDEAYDFTWVGKNASLIESAMPIRKTLRPCKEESKNWDTTENLYIEGDNLEVLKLLQESYLGKVKMIYIDPPYNTGNDFIYNDDFKQSAEEYSEETGEINEEGERLFKNTDSNGRFHSDWCSMIYPRLLIARNMLSDDGVIFISIDDHEVAQLRKICDEVFGERNFVTELVWERAFAPKNDAKYVSNSHDYVLLYSKSIDNFRIGRLPRTEEADARYSNRDNDPRGVWQSDNLTVKTYSPSGDYPITTPSGRVVEPPTGRCWSLSKNKFFERLQDNRIWFGDDGNGVPRIKRFLSELLHEGMTPTSILFYKDVGHNQEGSQEVGTLLNGGYFDGPKPVRLLRRLLTLANTENDSIILDFFSGSATTAHAVMQLNAEDGGNRKFIMVQLPEKTDEKSEAYQAGYKNICEIGKERIRRAGEQISKGDIGFRVFKADDTNMKDIYYSTQDHSQDVVNLLESNIKEDRNDLDLLFGCLLDWGLPLSYRHISEMLDNCTIHTIDEDVLIACFDENVSEDVIIEIAKRKPLRAVFRDSSFTHSATKINVKKIFGLLSPSTAVKVI